ncbi:MAG: hypothetical protein HY064_05975 [Bacteroidetes bacterium]|nr:hypothetical protein [Bacteroidota bacterium]
MNFDKAGRILTDSGNGTILKSVKEYDAYGNITKCLYYGPDGKIYNTYSLSVSNAERSGIFSCSYDKNGKVLVKKAMNQDGTELYTSIYKYDEKGNLTETKGGTIDIYERNYENENDSELVQTIYNSAVTYKYNDKNLLTEKIIFGVNELSIVNYSDSILRFHETYAYDSHGRMIRKLSKQVVSWEVYTDSRHEKNVGGVKVRSDDAGVATDSTLNLMMYKYDANGNATEIVKLNSDIDKDVRYVFKYDGRNHKTESDRYDEYNISYEYRNDEENKIIAQAASPDFDMIAKMPEYWSMGTPTKETWSYDAQGRKTEWLVYGFQNGLSYRVAWQYSENGKLSEETHYDVYHNTVRAQMKFDDKENVISETDYDYWNKTERNYTYGIEYY